MEEKESDAQTTLLAVHIDTNVEKPVKLEKERVGQTERGKEGESVCVCVFEKEERKFFDYCMQQVGMARFMP